MKTFRSLKSCEQKTKDNGTKVCDKIRDRYRDNKSFINF